jgi:transaldolase
MIFFGIGAQTREERVKARGDLANELRAAKKQGKSPEKIQAIIKEHLKNAASTEAKEDLRTADPEMAAEIQKIIAGEASPELAAAMEKEKYDITLRAVELLSSEDRTKQKGSGEDKGIQTAREIIKQIAPTFEEANVLFTEAYRQRHGSPTELVGPEGKKRRQTKKSVAASRARLRAMYQD